MTAGFRCKKFFVAQQHCAMKVSTDALLLGAWCPIPASGDMLDIGTGTGILALMLAQRSDAVQQIDAVELDAAAARQAVDNVCNSPWPDRIRVIERNILTYPGSTDHLQQRRYQLIVSNPPYFTAALPSQDASRTLARHNSGLPFADLLQIAATLATADGLLALVLPVQEAQRLLALAPGYQWYLRCQQDVSTTASQTPRCSLLLFSRQPVTTLYRTPLALHDAASLLLDATLGLASVQAASLRTASTTTVSADGGKAPYSKAYRQLLRDFYLKF